MNRLEGKQILLIVGQKNYNEEEFDYLFNRLEGEGADVFVASNLLEQALGRLEGSVTPDEAIEEVDPAEYDALVFIGGYAARLFLWDDEKTHRLVQQANQLHKLIAAISTAPVVLAHAGILKGRRATVYPDYDATLSLQENGAKFVYEDVVVDENIITCNHTRYKEEFAEAIIKYLSEAHERASKSLQES